MRKNAASRTGGLLFIHKRNERKDGDSNLFKAASPRSYVSHKREAGINLSMMTTRSVKTTEELVDAIFDGHCVVLINGFLHAYILETHGTKNAV